MLSLSLFSSPRAPNPVPRFLSFFLPLFPFLARARAPSPSALTEAPSSRPRPPPPPLPSLPSSSPLFRAGKPYHVMARGLSSGEAATAAVLYLISHVPRNVSNIVLGIAGARVATRLRRILLLKNVRHYRGKKDRREGGTRMRANSIETAGCCFARDRLITVMTRLRARARLEKHGRESTYSCQGESYSGRLPLLPPPPCSSIRPGIKGATCCCLPFPLILVRHNDNDYDGTRGSHINRRRSFE